MLVSASTPLCVCIGAVLNVWDGVFQMQTWLLCMWGCGSSFPRPWFVCSIHLLHKHDANASVSPDYPPSTLPPSLPLSAVSFSARSLSAVSFSARSLSPFSFSARPLSFVSFSASRAFYSSGRLTLAGENDPRAAVVSGNHAYFG